MMKGEKVVGAVERFLADHTGIFWSARTDWEMSLTEAEQAARNAGREETLKIQDRAVAQYTAKRVLERLGIVPEQEVFSYDDIMRATRAGVMQASGLAKSEEWPTPSLVSREALK